MTRIIAVIIGLLFTSALLAQITPQEEIADTLLTHLKSEISFKESYYLINSDNQEVNEHIQNELLKHGLDLRKDSQQASKSIQLEYENKVSFKEAKSFLFNRQVRIENYQVQAIIIDNNTSKIDSHITTNITKESPVKDGPISLWKPVLVSLLAGTLVYSLWSIE